MGVRTLSRTLQYAALLVWAVIVLTPLYWVVITSLKHPIDVFEGPTYLPWIDFTPTLDAWREVFRGILGPQVLSALKTSVVVTVVSALAATVLGGPAGYGLSRFSYRFAIWRSSDDWTFFFLAQKMMPPVIVAIPMLILFKSIGLNDSMLGLIIAYTAFSIPFVVWVSRSFFMHIPRDLEDSARIDGTTLVGAFFRVIVPVALPGLVTAFLVSFIFTWNDLLMGLALAFRRAVTLPVLIAGQVTIQGPQFWTMSVLSLVSIVPSVVVGSIALGLVRRGVLSGSGK